MVKSKKISKSSIAIIALSLLLVLSMVISLSGAWFTDRKSGTELPVTMGTVNIQTSDGALSIVQDEAAASITMPGDTLKVTGKVINSGTAQIWVRYKLGHSYAVEGDLKDALDAAFTGAYIYVADPVAASANTSIAKDVLLSTELGNAAQGATFNVTLVMEAIQWANNHLTTCEAAFADFAETEVPARV